MNTLDLMKGRNYLRTDGIPQASLPGGQER